jgi:hypothetical protein
MSASARVSAILFLCLFAGQAGLIALSPVLVEVASNLGVSTAAAGQLRTISGLAAGLTALCLAAVSRRLQLRQLLVRVVEPGHHTSTAQIDAVGGRPGERPDLLGRADGHNPVTAHRKRFGGRLPRVSGPDDRIQVHTIGRSIAGRE